MMLLLLEPEEQDRHHGQTDLKIRDQVRTVPVPNQRRIVVPDTLITHQRIVARCTGDMEKEHTSAYLPTHVLGSISFPQNLNETPGWMQS